MKHAHVFLCVVMSLVHSLTLSCQIIEGTVSASGTKTPLQSASVVVTDSGESVVAGALTLRDGRFSVTLPHAGRFRVRVRRTGFAQHVSPFLSVGQNQTMRFDAELITLDPLTVRTPRSAPCGLSANNTGAAQLWELARNVVDGTVASAFSRSDAFLVTQYERWRDARTGRLTRTSQREGHVYAKDLFRRLPAEPLAAEDVVYSTLMDTTVYSAPDAGTLLSDTFLDTHCLSSERDAKGHPRQVGLRFEPSPGSRRAGVVGTLWFADSSNDLLTMEFHYTTHDGRPGKALPSGEIQYLQVEAGEWAVERWNIHVPSVARAGTSRLAAGRLPQPAGQMVDIGAVLARAPNVATHVNEGTFSLTGAVSDSSGATETSGIEVSLTGLTAKLDRATTTSAAGVFAFTDLPSGSYLLRFRSQRLDTLNLRITPVELTGVSGKAVTVTVALPTRDQGLRDLCSRPTADASTRIVYGYLRTTTGTPVLTGEVRGHWWSPEFAGSPLAREYEEIALADDGGHYALCELPSNRFVVISPSHQGNETVPVILAPGSEPQYREFAIAHDGDPSRIASGPVKHQISGTVVEANGRPVAGAEVSVANETQRSTTDEFGSFFLDDLSEGAHLIQVRRLGYDPSAITVHTADSSSRLAFVIRPSAQRLANVNVLATRASAGAAFAERARTGMGHYFTEGDDVLVHASKISDVVRRVSGVSILPNGIVTSERGMVTQNADDCRYGLPVYLDLMHVSGGRIPPFSSKPAPGAPVQISTDVLGISSIGAIEIYSGPATIPSSLGIRSSCGAIFIWSKR